LVAAAETLAAPGVSALNQQSRIPLGRVAAPVPEADPVAPVVLDAPLVVEPDAPLGVLMPLELPVVLDVFAAGDGLDGELRTWFVATSQHCVGLSRTWADAGAPTRADVASAHNMVVVESLMIRPSCMEPAYCRRSANAKPLPVFQTTRASRSHCS
jgi:hypothetical protein